MFSHSWRSSLVCVSYLYIFVYLGGELVRSLDLGEDTLLGHVLQGLVDEAVELDNVHLVVGGDVLLDGGEGAAVPLLQGLDGGLDHGGDRRVGRRCLGLGGLLGRTLGGLGVGHVVDVESRIKVNPVSRAPLPFYTRLRRRSPTKGKGEATDRRGTIRVQCWRANLAGCR